MSDDEMEDFSEEEEELNAQRRSHGASAGPRQEFLEFEDEEEEAKPLSGRRLKREKERKKKMKAGTFESMGLTGPVIKAIKRKGFRLPTPIQRRAIPLLLQGVDVIGMARTGSGKTAAFVIPMLEKLKAHSPKAGARAVLLAPTRELALQTHKAVRELGRFTDLRTAVLVGGDSMEAQFAELAQNPDIIVATPGRLLHHLSEIDGMSLRAVQYCVLDEADRLFEMGFAEQVRELLSKMSEGRQTLLFSATLPSSLAEFAQAGLQSPQLVRLNTETKISPDLRLAFFTARQDDKIAALLYLIREVVPADQPTIVFAATRHHVDYIHTLLTKEGIPAACVFGAMDQTARKIHVAKFRAQKVNLLITTDVAARGIDIPLIDNVINLDFPAKPELFIHRVGRAARMGRSGTAYSVLTRDELPYLLDLHLYLARKLKPAPIVPEAGVEGGSTSDLAVLGDDGSSSLYGTFPQVALGPLIEHLRNVDEANADLSGMQRSLHNAFGLYMKTRPAASTESTKRARELGPEGVHPLLLAALPKTKYTDVKNEAALAEFTRALKTFRPSATVLEAEIASVKSSFMNPLMEADHARTKSSHAMQNKRAAHAAVIERERQKRQRKEEATAAATAGEGDDDLPAARARSEDGSSDFDDDDEQVGGGAGGVAAARKAAAKAAILGDGVLNEGKYRDKELYISHVRDPNRPGAETFEFDKQQQELQAAVLDMTGEDRDAMAAQKRQWHWDKRKKKYVQVQGVDALAAMKKGSKSIRTESGKKIDKGKAGETSGLYKKWVKSQHRRVAAAGSMEEEAGARGQADLLSRRFDRSMRHKSWKPKGPAEVRGGSQLKSKDQVRKSREKTERRKEWAQQRQQQKKAAAGGKKGKGRKGGRG